MDEYGKEIIDPYDRTYQEGCVRIFLNYFRWSWSGNNEKIIDEDLYWLGVKHFGYGDDKWE